MSVRTPSARTTLVAAALAMAPPLAFGPADATADGTLTGGPDDVRFGQSVASAGDVNGDGYADLVVGAPQSRTAAGSEVGRAYLYFGGPGQTFDATPDGTATGESAGDKFGTSVASTGDVNGDGYSDVVIGAPLRDASAGMAYIYFGGLSGTFPPGLGVVDGKMYGAVGEELGGSVASAGDVNGDGFADVVVGASLSDATAPGVGSAYLYFGGAGSFFEGTHDGPTMET